MDTLDPRRRPIRHRLRRLAGFAAGALVVFAGVIAFAWTALGWTALGWTADGAMTAPMAPGVSRTSAVAIPGASAEGYAVWERNADGQPVRWDACAPVQIVFSPAGAPTDVSDDLDVAVATLRQATGLDIQVTGTSGERPHGAREPFQPERYGPRWAPVLVGWAMPHADGLPLRDIDRGLGIPIAVGAEGERVYVTGQVVLNAERRDLRAGGGDREHAWRATILHELAHVLGLAHVDDPSELMHVHPGDGPVAFGPGDLAGLRAVGADAACAGTPRPREVEVLPPPAA